MFILQQGQSPLHVALPVVCSTGEFPNDYFHRHQRLVTQQKFDSPLKIRATAHRLSTEPRSGVNVCQWLICLSCFARSLNVSSTHPTSGHLNSKFLTCLCILQARTQVHSLTLFFSSGFIYAINNPCVVGLRWDVRDRKPLFNGIYLDHRVPKFTAIHVLENTFPAVIESSGTGYLVQSYYLTWTNWIWRCFVGCTYCRRAWLDFCDKIIPAQRYRAQWSNGACSQIVLLHGFHCYPHW